MPSDRRGFLRELAGAAREVRGVGGAGRDAFAEARDALLRGEVPEEAVAERDPDRLADAELERYSRQLGLPEWSERAQLALRTASVLIVGAGALGSPAALYLAAAGIGRLGIVDDDAVGLPDLQGEPLHFSPDVGVAKVHSAAAKLGYLNPEVEVVPYQVRVEASNAAGLLEGHDLVVDGSDVSATRYAVNAAACAAGVPLVEGGVLGTSGFVMAVRPGETACYRCAFGAPPPAGAAPTRAPAGGLGPAAGVIGSLLALEALKLLTGFAAPLTGAYLRVELASLECSRVPVERRPDCPDCGSEVASDH